MGQAMPFGDAGGGSTASPMSKNLVSIIQHRLAERGRKRLQDEIQEARREFAEGGCRPASVDELMSEILS